ncbi:MAG: hypothetical protein FJW34_16805, partial [Acidobacteria bacterium]|nr:hypothetical protein [Acidobacteriota bacterium]
MDRDTSTWTFQSAAVATGNGQIMDVTGLAAVAVQIAGITTATIAFEANVDKTNWVAVQAVNLNDGSVGATATADGLYLVSTTGLKQLRCRVSAWTAGTITVIGNGVMNAAGLTLADVDVAGTETVTANQGTAHASEKWRVSVIDALPAGASAIGKLAANSGIDIGDVDVLTEPSGPGV